MKAKSKKIFIILLLCAVLLAAGIAVAFLCISGNSDFTDSLPLDTVLTKEQAQSDLDFMYRTVKDNHICYIDGSGLDKGFDSAYEMADEISAMKKRMGMRSRLSEIGCTSDEQIAELTKKSMSMLMKRNPIELSESDIGEMYNKLR